mgnify:CR=1 FL=1
MICKFQEQIAKAKSIAPSRPVEMDDSNESDNEIIGPLPPSAQSAKNESTSPSLEKSNNEDLEDSDDSEDDSDDIASRIPYTLVVKMQHGQKAILALACDEMSFWDFAGMDSAMRSFCTIQPCENYSIRGLHYSQTGELIMVISGNA